MTTLPSKSKSMWYKFFVCFLICKSLVGQDVDMQVNIDPSFSSEKEDESISFETDQEEQDPLRFFTSRLYTKGQIEINIFNNYYTQNDPGEPFGQRANFFTSSWQYLYGINSRLNVGLELKLRSASGGNNDVIGLWDALKFSNEGVVDPQISQNTYRRSGLTAIGPRIKYQPFTSIGNITFQHTLFIPTIGEAEGGGDNGGFLDWGAPSLLNDLFYDQEVGAKGSIFVQVGLHFENMNTAFFRSGDGYYQVSTPVSVIFSHFTTAKSTFYFLINATPRWGYNVSNGGDDVSVFPDDFNQYGIGYKYFVTPKLQAEVLVTKFNGVVQDRSAATYNFGVRYFGR